VSLEDYSIQLHSIQASPSCVYFKSKIKDIENKVAVLKAYILEIESIQTYFVKFRVFYLNPRVVRFVQNTAKLFGVVEDYWRVLLKETKENTSSSYSGVESLLSESASEVVARLNEMHITAEKSYHTVIAFIGNLILVLFIFYY
jgi:hypothetical protein